MTSSEKSSGPAIFISYSREDRQWLEFMQGHLQVAAINGHFETWDDRRITGQDWEKEINDALCQGLTLAEASALIEAEAGRLKSSADIGTTVAALRDGLPGTGDGREIAPILPDIVGEAAIMCWLGEGCVLRGLGIDPLASIQGAAATALDRASQALVRTAQDFAAAGRDEPVLWLYAIAQAAEADPGALMTIADALPHQTVALRELAAALTQSTVDRVRRDVRAGQATEAMLGTWLANLGVRQGGLGRRVEALAASQEASPFHRRSPKPARTPSCLVWR
jgi:hypothetical protein